MFNFHYVISILCVLFLMDSNIQISKEIINILKTCRQEAFVVEIVSDHTRCGKKNDCYYKDFLKIICFENILENVIILLN